MITTWSRGPAGRHMAEDILVDLVPVVRRHPWWRARARLILALLGRLGIGPPARVLDAGCGWGITLEALERQGYRATGMDISRRALERLDRPGRRLVEADMTRLPPDDVAPFDAVLALDVIEHLDDDRHAVAGIARLARPGGVVVVSVPAGPELYSEFDAVQGHRRRYVPETLRGTFAGSGLAVERLFWWGGWLLPLLSRQRRAPRQHPSGAAPGEIYASYLRVPPWPLSGLLSLAFAAEQGPALAGWVPRGTSLIAVGRRPGWPSARPGNTVSPYPRPHIRAVEASRRTL